MAGGGTKLERSSPCSSSSASQAASATSVLRPGRILTWRALTSSSASPRSSSTYQTGFQYWPVASITTWVTPSASSQSASAARSALKVANVRTSWRRRPPAPGAGVRTQATTSRLATSNPAQRSTSRSTRPPPTVARTACRAWQGRPINEAVRRARSNSSRCREGPRHQSVRRACRTKQRRAQPGPAPFSSVAAPEGHGICENGPKLSIVDLIWVPHATKRRAHWALIARCNSAPPSTSARRTQLRNDSVPTPSWRATRVTIPTPLPVSISNAIGTARSRSSGWYRFAVLVHSTRPRLQECDRRNDAMGTTCASQEREEPMAMPMPAEWSFGATIPAKDLDGTRRFYEDVLGAQVVMEDPGGILYRSGDSTFSLYPTEFAGTAQHTLGAFMVADVEAAVAGLRAKGVTFEEYDMPGVKTVNGIAELGGFKGAWFKDPEGNILSVVQSTAA